jgi:hypothetical protein
MMTQRHLLVRVLDFRRRRCMGYAEGRHHLRTGISPLSLIT